MPRRFVPTPKRTKPSVIQPLPEDDAAWSRLPSVLHYAGMGHTKFYELIGKKLMPRPTQICWESYWRVGEIREAVEKLKEIRPSLKQVNRGQRKIMMICGRGKSAKYCFKINQLVVSLSNHERRERLRGTG